MSIYQNIIEPKNGFQLVGPSIRLVGHWGKQPAKEAKNICDFEDRKGRNSIVICRNCDKFNSQQEKLIEFKEALKPTFKCKFFQTSTNLQTLYNTFYQITLTDTVVAATKLICKNNYFEYNKALYRQTNGIAMGTNAAVQLANFYLDKLDRKLSPYCKVYVSKKRYVEKIKTIAQKCIKGIKLTFEINQKFAINKYAYIPYNSQHNPSVIKAIIEGELIRYMRQTTRYRDFCHIRSLFKQRLLNKGYPILYLQQMFFKFTYDRRLNYIEPKIKAKTDQKIVPFIIKYNKSRNYKLLKNVISNLNKETMSLTNKQIEIVTDTVIGSSSLNPIPIDSTNQHSETIIANNDLPIISNNRKIYESNRTNQKFIDFERLTPSNDSFH
ncbi:hypothetical protein BB561_006487 [Smittium simulii]|uniref:Helix-turn-helix domain-containing protein n=1 Tax=Smittium simulii TaxID=133385 RepID=A0A2T9Y3S5_9FUNG|nr:hypothetical protein BB561_006487 [Smittium simulii]